MGIWSGIVIKIFKVGVGSLEEWLRLGWDPQKGG